MQESRDLTTLAPTLFARDTAVTPIGERRFSADITDRWNGLAGRPLGGYVLATALRALLETMVHPHLFVASAFFLHPVEPGPVEISTGPPRHARPPAPREAP